MAQFEEREQRDPFEGVFMQSSGDVPESLAGFPREVASDPLPAVLAEVWSRELASIDAARIAIRNIDYPEDLLGRMY